ncbi:MAG: DUF2711 family protein [Bacteroidales bacterium]
MEIEIEYKYIIEIVAMRLAKRCHQFNKMSELKNKNLYPDEETSLLEHYSDFDNVFVGFLPFFKLNKENCDTKSSKKIISLEEAREKDEIFKIIGNYSNVSIYSSNDCYPSDEEILQSGKVKTWKEIIENTEFENYKELNKALMTSIGAFKEELQRDDLLEILDKYTEKNNIWHPTKGMFDYFTKASIYDIIKSANITEIEVEDEFYENRKIIDLTSLTKNEFCKKIDFKDYYIYSKDKKILFSISWDYFFFFIAINEKAFSKQEIEKYFEGFWATENDSHLWYWDKGEIDGLLNNENENIKEKNNKYWWQHAINAIWRVLRA